MSDVIETLATQVGISPELAKNGVGAVLAFLKEHFGETALAGVQSVLPDPDGLIESSEKAQSLADSSTGGGLLGMVAGLAGKLMGGDGAGITKLLTILTTLGFSAEQVTAFLPKLMELLQKFLPADLLAKLAALGLCQVDETTTTS